MVAELSFEQTSETPIPVLDHADAENILGFSAKNAVNVRLRPYVSFAYGDERAPYFRLAYDAKDLLGMEPGATPEPRAGMTRWL